MVINLLMLLTPYIHMFACDNPSEYALAGTNCYMVGSGRDRYFIDAGEKDQPGFVSRVS